MYLSHTEKAAGGGGEVRQRTAHILARRETRKSSGCGPLYRRTAMHGGLQVLAATLLFGRGLWEPWPPALQRWCCWRAGRQGDSGLGGPGYFGGERAGMAEQ